MNLKTKRMLCLVIGIASILTIVSTISYAYFTAMSDMKPAQSIINTATVSARFVDYGDEVGGNLNFGESITKKFTIENTGTAEVHVKIYWVDLINTYINGSLTYTLSYSENEAGPYTEVVTKTNIPRSEMVSREVLANSLTIPVGKTYYYNLVITLNYLDDVNQDADLNAVFNSKFGIEDINYVEPNPASNMIKANQGVRTSFDEPATTDEGVFEMEDDYGTSYYYRGAVENNYVKFAGFYWRIIRLNGDGSLRIIYDGTTPHANGEVSDDRFTKVGQKFNAKYDDAKYVGWMFGGAQGVASTSKEQAQLNETNSDIKTVVDGWYKTNIQDKGYGQYVSDTLFCNDRTTPGKESTGLSSDTGLGYGTNVTAYGAGSRTSEWNFSTTASAPTFRCAQKNDAFTVSDAAKGNGALDYPVGLITADEIIAAGSGKANTVNNSYYLYKSKWYWSMSSRYFRDDGYASIYVAHTAAALAGASVSWAADGGGVSPVINLSAEYVSTLKGTGTMTDPYTSE